MIEFVRRYFQQGNPRSILAKKQIVGSLFVRAASIAISLILVPLTINYVNPARYGVWLVLSSMVSWASFFDVGFNSGLRNRFAEAKAKGNDTLARIYVSTAYVFLGILFSFLMLILLVVSHFVDWGVVLNIRSANEDQVGAVAAVIIVYFCVTFVLRIVNTLLTADQKPAHASLIDMFGQLISLAVIFVLTRFGNGSLMHLTLALCLPQIVVLLAANLVLYGTACSAYAPSFGLAQSAYARDILGLGVKFFLPSLACIIQFQTTSFLIAHYFDVTQVTAYNIAYKYFYVLQMVFTIVTTPLWSSVTDSYSRGDEIWIRHVVNKYLYLLLGFVAMALLMLAFADTIYDFWIGRNRLHISFNISLMCCLFVISSMFATIFVSVLNGIGALKIQIVSSFIAPVVFVVLSLFFILKLRTGAEGILIASILSNVFGVVIAPIQYYKVLINKSSAKVWYA
jgi:O-antigen/teichoic acid export membrane protein